MATEHIWNQVTKNSNLTHHHGEAVEISRVNDTSKLNKDLISMIVDTEANEFGITDRIRSKPEFELMLQVFKQSLLDCLATTIVRGRVTNRESKENTLEALAWLIDGEEHWIYSLIGTCEFLGLDHFFIRELVLNKLDITVQGILRILRAEGWMVNGYHHC